MPHPGTKECPQEFGSFRPTIDAEIVAPAVAAERERCARVVETALRDRYRAITGADRGLSEVEVFLAAAIRSGK